MTGSAQAEIRGHCVSVAEATSGLRIIMAGAVVA